VATLTIRDLDDGLKLKLRLRAASQNRSMEEEARQILRVALTEPAAARGSFVDRVKSRFEGLGDVQLPIEPREPVRQPLEIHEPEAPYVATSASTRAPAKRSRTPRTGR
jgi:plasmid stability protein